MAENQVKSTGPTMLPYYLERVIDASCVVVWIFLSATMVFYNKFLLSYFGFYYPITLTLWHMVVCTSLATACVQSGLVKALEIPNELYIKKIIPIAACYAGALWTSNAAYALTSVSFAQMVKAGMPVAVFFTGICFGVEQFRWVLLADIVLVTCGVGISAYGEAHLVVNGLVLLVVSMVFDAIRLTLTQQMIQSSGIRFNPITTLYYIAPVASCFLSIPFMLLEVRGATGFLGNVSGGLWHFIFNAGNAFALNLSVYLLLGRTSALTMNVCGLIKDWFTIAGSMLIFGSIVTVTNIVGYLVAFAGVLWYNYLRMPRLTQQADASKESAPDMEKQVGPGQVTPSSSGKAPKMRQSDHELELISGESEQQPLLGKSQSTVNGGNDLANHIDFKKGSQAMDTSQQQMYESRKVTR
ncbi:hypothetical protein CEUSTIGMA_g10631.t1 [Chlamydomonas eustigma]|uniref:Sugar phosphate transporter domain-containing protein n=1 Tax=Chlamydomonas eustigma TaxID=1157962 RepID=A0A250XJE3_9CHLO|nr:hypothetical protein CEUSTIGMA_g10631.t1 [Chlamydomonas eustigma]|eukprot:GAX83205.1 hypothetical protein CEUSTIGMA_g10631.t1 [Chlamydomonas eustigma]